MQTSYSLDPAIAKEGMIADSRRLSHFVSRIAEGAIKAGLGCFRAPVTGASFSNYGGDPGAVYQISSPAPAASVNAILASGGASSLSIQTVSGTSLNGSIGTSLMYPPRFVQFVFSSHANWDATDITVTGELDGVVVTDTIAVPDAGNATVVGTQYMDKVTSWTIPAQSGASGTYTVGVAILDGTLDITDFEGFAVYDNCLVPNTIPSQDQTAEYHDKGTVSVMYKGSIWCIAENAVTQGAAVYVRTTTGSGGTTIGAVRGTDTDTSTAVVIPNARFGNTAAAGALVKVELY